MVEKHLSRILMQYKFSHGVAQPYHIGLMVFVVVGALLFNQLYNCQRNPINTRIYASHGSTGHSWYNPNHNKRCIQFNYLQSVHLSCINSNSAQLIRTERRIHVSLNYAITGSDERFSSGRLHTAQLIVNWEFVNTFFIKFELKIQQFPQNTLISKYRVHTRIPIVSIAMH